MSRRYSLQPRLSDHDVILVDEVVPASAGDGELTGLGERRVGTGGEADGEQLADRRVEDLRGRVAQVGREETSGAFVPPWSGTVT